ENKLILNVTSNGKLLIPLKDKDLKEVLKNITMISLSFDNYKIKDMKDFKEYYNLVKRIKKLNIQVGSNYLVESDNQLMFIRKIETLFKMGVDRVFALCLKNIPTNILSMKKAYTYLTLKYKHFYIDDLTKQILEEDKYKDWCKECHYFKDLISINEKGFITGCSFDDENKALLKLENPEDILKIVGIQGEKRFSCPYLIPKQEEIIEVKGGLNRNVTKS
ncbi:unnamed protein product, partial [marine sediment metagenome]